MSENKVPFHYPMFWFKGQTMGTASAMSRTTTAS